MKLSKEFVELQSSSSRVLIRLSVQGKGDAEGEIFRHLAPVTITALTRKMPIIGRISRFNCVFIYALSGAIAGVEKAKRDFKRGDIAFLPANGAICIFLKNSSMAKPMNPCGRITRGLEVMDRISPGDVLTVEKHEYLLEPNH